MSPSCAFRVNSLERVLISSLWPEDAPRPSYWGWDSWAGVKESCPTPCTVLSLYADETARGKKGLTFGSHGQMHDRPHTPDLDMTHTKKLINKCRLME